MAFLTVAMSATYNSWTYIFLSYIYTDIINETYYSWLNILLPSYVDEITT